MIPNLIGEVVLSADEAVRGEQPAELEKAEHKLFATLQARAALVGITLHQIEGDFGIEYVASKWNLTKAFASLLEVGVWLDRVTGESAKG